MNKLEAEELKLRIKTDFFRLRKRGYHEACFESIVKWLCDNKREMENHEKYCILCKKI